MQFQRLPTLSRFDSVTDWTTGRLHAIKIAQQEDQLPSRPDETQPTRHVMLSSARGLVTEMERVTTDQYIVRYHKSAADAGAVLDAGSWIGFRYSNADW